MFEKLTNLMKKDPLFLHKIGLVLGGIFGLLVGLVVSDRADQYEVEEVEEEVVDGAEKD